MQSVMFQIILTLLPLMVRCQQEQYHEVLSLISRLNGFFDFDHNIFLLDSSTDASRCFPAEESFDGNFTPQTVYSTDLNCYNEDDDTGEEILKSANTGNNVFLIVVAESLKFDDHTRLMAQVKAIREVKLAVKIGVFFVQNVTSMDVINDLFLWCISMSVRIDSIFGAIYSNIESNPTSEAVFNVFRYELLSPYYPYDFALINLTGSESIQSYFPERIRNYQTIPIKFEATTDLYQDDYSMPFYSAVVDFLNASYSVYVSSEGNFMVLSEDEALAANFSAITGTPPPEHGTANDIAVKNIRIYPYRMVKLVLLVPHARPYSGFMEYLQNTTWTLLLAYTFTVIAASTLLLTISGYLQTKKILLVQRVVDVINLLLNDNDVIRYGRLRRADVCVIVPLTFAGLIMMNGIVSAFQSYLTLPMYERQIKTIEDLFLSPIPILAKKYYWTRQTAATLEDLSQHGGWEAKVRATYADEIIDQLDKFNISAAFSMFHDEAQWYLEAQKRLGLKAYKLITETTLDTVFVTFHISGDYHLIGPINNLILRLQSSGLMQKWFDDRDQVQVEYLLKNSLDLQFESSDGSENDEFPVPIVVWCGWAGSGIVFICEIIWKKFELQAEQLKKTFCARLYGLVICPKK